VRSALARARITAAGESGFPSGRFHVYKSTALQPGAVFRMLLNTEVAMSANIKEECPVSHSPLPLAGCLFLLAILAFSPLVALRQRRSHRSPNTAPTRPPPSGPVPARLRLIACPRRRNGRGCAAACPGCAQDQEPGGDGQTFALAIEVPEVTVDVGVLAGEDHTSRPRHSSPRTSTSMRMDAAEGHPFQKRVEAPVTALLICEFAPTATLYL